MRQKENIEQLLELQPDYMGFIFFEKSARNASELSEELLLSFPKSVKKTGVFVNATHDFVQEKITKFALDAVQLHGNESPAYCTAFKNVEVIKAFGIDDEFDFKLLDEYKKAVDFFLFDTKTPLHGGSGRVFNWKKLNEYDQTVPFFLSGGLSAENIGEISQFPHLNSYAVDVNSKFETEPGLKNIALLKNSVFKTIRK